MAGQAGDRGSTAPRTPEGPPADPAAGIRASDTERDEVLAELHDSFVAGRLSHETFVGRVDATLRARRRRDLDPQLADLPGRRPPITVTMPARARELRRAMQAVVANRRAARQAQAMAAARPVPPATLMLPAPERPRYTIGRGFACDLSIADSSVSREHAELIRESGEWRLADLGSLNGTRLNGWRLTEPVLVRSGDLVTFGTVHFVLADTRDRGA